MSDFHIPKPGVYTILFVIVTILVLMVFNRGVNQNTTSYNNSTVEPFRFEVIDSVEHAEALKYTVRVTNISESLVEFAKTTMVIGDIHKNKRYESYYEKIGEDYSELAPNESILVTYELDGFPNEYVKSYWFVAEDVVFE